MKVAISIVAVVAVAAVAALGINAFANTGLTSQSNTLSDTSLAIGHVEFVLYDANGNIKSYSQGDNIVMDAGDSCASELLFGDTGLPACTGNPFNKIGIINGTNSIAESTNLSELNPAGTDNSNNLMAVVDAVATVPDTEQSQGTDSTIVNSNHLFNFVDGVNSTSVTGVILTDVLCTEATNGECSSLGTGEIFSHRTTTLSVSGGDTLEVTWTITVGSSS